VIVEFDLAYRENEDRRFALNRDHVESFQEHAMNPEVTIIRMVSGDLHEVKETFQSVMAKLV